MAKRFTSTEKWHDPWFRTLPLKMKVFWQYITENCDHAGVWNVDLELASFLTGATFEKDEILSAFKGRIEPLKKEGYWHLPQFVSFQYGVLKDDYNPHKPVMQSLQRHGISSLGQALPKAPQSLMGKDKDKDKEKEGGSGGNSVEVPFEEFYKEYPKHKARKDGEKAWLALNPKRETWETKIRPAIASLKRSEDWLKEDGKFIPLPASWIRGQRWEDEVPREKVIG